MTRFPGDIRFILWCGLAGTMIVLAVLPLEAVVQWLGWMN